MNKTDRQLRTRFETVFMNAAIEGLLKERKRMAKVYAKDLLEDLECSPKDFDESLQWEGDFQMAIEAGNAAVRKAKLLDDGDLPSYVDSNRLEHLVSVQVENIVIQPIKLAIRYYRQRIKDSEWVVDQVFRSRLPNLNIGHFNSPGCFGSEERPLPQVDGLDIV